MVNEFYTDKPYVMKSYNPLNNNEDISASYEFKKTGKRKDEVGSFVLRLSVRVKDYHRTEWLERSVWFERDEEEVSATELEKMTSNNETDNPVMVYRLIQVLNPKNKKKMDFALEINEFGSPSKKGVSGFAHEILVTSKALKGTEEQILNALISIKYTFISFGDNKGFDKAEEIMRKKFNVDEDFAFVLAHSKELESFK